MNQVRHPDWELETARLERVMEEVALQLDVLEQSTGQKRSGLRETGKWMTDELPMYATDFDTILDLAQQVDLLRGQQQEYIMTATQLRRLRRMTDVPYFGRMDFQERGEATVEPMYIGIGLLLDKATGDPLVFDWRAPISAMYYDYQPGEASYKAPNGLVHGTITLKRQYQIRLGQLETMFDSALHIGDDVLQSILGKHADDRMRSIVTSIQRDQNQIIRDLDHRILVVQGPAGSGKTSVALQRIAYLLYQHRRTMGPHHIAFITPNRLFQDYISEVLPELGEENTLQFTFADYANRVLSSYGRVEGVYSQLETLLAIHEDEADESATAQASRADAILFKQTPGFIHALHRYADSLEAGGIQFHPIAADERLVVVDADLLATLYYNAHYAHLASPHRIEKIQEWVETRLAEYEKRLVKGTRKRLTQRNDYVGSDEEIRERAEQLVRRKMKPLKARIRELPSIDIMAIYRQFWTREDIWQDAAEYGVGKDRMADIRGTTLRGLESGQIPYEDVPALLYLYGRLQGAPALTQVRHVMIDEAQDYTLLQYQVLRQLFPRAQMTILGDLNQALHPSMHISDYEGVVSLLTANDAGGDTASLIELVRSYRSTSEILALAKSFLPEEESGQMEAVNRSGDLPDLWIGATEDEMLTAMADCVLNLLKDGNETVAIICRTAAECRMLFDKLHKLVSLNLVAEADDRLKRGVIVLPSYLAKGLEFDAVVLHDVSDDRYGSTSDRKLLYTMCTRALHRLALFVQGLPTKWLPDESSLLYNRVSNPTSERR